MRKMLEGYIGFRPFTDSEAWGLFKLAAIGEAIGWTLLGSAVIFDQHVNFNNHMFVKIAGQTHGMLFLIYLCAVMILSPSLAWTTKRIFIAGLVSVVPLGSLIFEQYEAHRRSAEAVSVVAYHGYMSRLAD